MRTMVLPMLMCAWIVPALAQNRDARDSKADQAHGALNAADLAKALHERGSVVVRGILFDTGRATIKRESAPHLAVIRDVLTRDPSLKLEVQAHTDNAGAKASNLSLSRARAAAVRDYLIKTLGVAPDRLTATGFGDSRPVADNSTDAGRAENRRIELVMIAAGKGAAAPTPSGAGEWTGRVTTGMMAIGGETTGILLVTDRDQIELQPADEAMRQRLQGLNGKTVTIRGTLETIRGVEVRTRRVIKVTEIISGTTDTSGTAGAPRDPAPSATSSLPVVRVGPV
jgi:outer membrane protein OmpA-like peptidoglycan-associated protein